MIPIPEELLEQLERGNVLLFVGERIVHDAEGRAVIDRLAAQMAARSGLTADGEWSFPEAAQAYQDEEGRQALMQFLCDELEVLGDEPQPIHGLITELADCKVLATTCLDRRLERALQNRGCPVSVVIRNEDVPFADERGVQVYKLRGSVEQPVSMVLTTDQYEAFERQMTTSLVLLVLQGYLARKTILFLGYDLSDPHFRRLYRKAIDPLDTYARRAYALFANSPSSSVSRWCKRRDIQVIEADTTDFLEGLLAQIEARPHSAPAAAPQPAAPLPDCPYKFLDYYEARDAAIFFGREGETLKSTSLIHAHRLVLLYGASGTGKTSLLLAGAVPRLEQAEPPYETIYVRALEDPAQAIHRAVRRKLPEACLPGEGPLLELLDAATRALGRTLVLVLDQFEEFFIRLSPEFRAAFIAELGALYDAPDVPVKVVLSLREDWLAAVNEIEERIPEVFRTRMRLLPRTRAQAQEAITAPVERLGASYEPDLVRQLLDDLATDGEAVMPPQLQLVCSALYDGLGPDERRITMAAYQKLEGARGVLQQYLDDELGRLGRDEGALARATLEELVTSQGTKAVKSSEELALALRAEQSMLQPVLEKLVRTRLVRVVEPGDGGTAYELAHEYLIAEIALSPEAVARKEAEELLRQGVNNWQRFQTLLSEDVLALIDAQKDRLRPSAQEQELLQLSAAYHAKPAQRLLYGAMGGMLGGSLGGLGAGVVSYVMTQIVGAIVGTTLVVAFFGAVLGFGISMGRIVVRYRTIYPIIGGAAVGSLLGLLLAPYLGLPAGIGTLQQILFGVMYGGGIAAGVELGRRLTKVRRIPVWALLGALVGMLLGGVVGSAYVPALAGAGITVGIGLGCRRLQVKTRRQQTTPLTIQTKRR
jgi:Cdc6-like AAA superfamily ATPase